MASKPIQVFLPHLLPPPPPHPTCQRLLGCSPLVQGAGHGSGHLAKQAAAQVVLQAHGGDAGGSGVHPCRCMEACREEKRVGKGVRRAGTKAVAMTLARVVDRVCCV